MALFGGSRQLISLLIRCVYASSENLCQPAYFGLAFFVVLVADCGCWKTNPSEPEATIGEKLNEEIPSNYPSATSGIYYNVPPFGRPPEDPEDEEYPDVTADLRKKKPANEYFNTVRSPTTISGSELASISLLAERTVKDFVTEQNIPRRGELGDEIWRAMDEFITPAGDAMGCWEPLDRTLLMPLTDPVLYSPKFIRVLQETVLREHPLWRFIVYVDAFGYEREHLVALAIYPDAIVLGEEQYDLSLQDDQVRKWQDAMQRVIDHTRGAEIRQLRWAASRLPDLLEQLRSKHVVLVAAADNWLGDTSQHSMWIMQGGSEFTFRTDIFPGLATGRSFYVTKEGALSGIFQKGRPFLYLRTVPARKTHQLTVRYNKAKAKPWESGIELADQTEFTIVVRPKDIRTESDLKSDDRLSHPLQIEFPDD